MWYGAPPAAPLSAAFAQYRRLLDADAEGGDEGIGLEDAAIDVACPYPPHLLDAVEHGPTQRTAEWARQTDVLYELFALAAGARLFQRAFLAAYKHVRRV